MLVLLRASLLVKGDGAPSLYPKSVSILLRLPSESEANPVFVGVVIANGVTLSLDIVAASLRPDIWGPSNQI